VGIWRAGGLGSEWLGAHQLVELAADPRAGEFSLFASGLERAHMRQQRQILGDACISVRRALCLCVEGQTPAITCAEQRIEEPLPAQVV
jgi:hypothetical protein